MPKTENDRYVVQNEERGGWDVVKDSDSGSRNESNAHDTEH